VPERATSDHIGYFADFLPTCAALAGAKPAVRTDGLSLVPTLRGEGEQAQHLYLYWEFYEGGGARAIRQGRWKGVRDPWDASLQLFDVEKDTGETMNLAGQYPGIVAKCEAAMQEAHVPNPNYQVAKKNEPDKK
jgi:arylsulfatase A-like enzyme